MEATHCLVGSNPATSNLSNLDFSAIHSQGPLSEGPISGGQAIAGAEGSSCLSDLGQCPLSISLAVDVGW